ncbi:MAG TPA: rhomboid family intramembrane serine protease, partial [Desulfoprunum sp.]|nr:rhomboid family intramembrane serine protease [Desulfoprunum sp.]
SQIGGWALGIFIFGFLVPGINNFGHAGGMLSGALAGYVLGYRDRSQDRFGHKVLSMACIIGTVIVLIWSIINGLFFLLS